MITAIDPKDNRLLHYQMIHSHAKVSFPTVSYHYSLIYYLINSETSLKTIILKCNNNSVLKSIFVENRGVHLRYDLLDCHVSICSPQVLSQYMLISIFYV